MTERRLGLWMALWLVTALTLMPVAASAAQQTAEPALLNLGWWWKEAETQEHNIGGFTVTVGTTSPFCPTVSGGLGEVPGACAAGRFPVEIVGGEYDQPDKLSGLGFDLSYLTPGSTVTKFEVKLLEAEPGCYDGDDEGTECTPGPAAPGDHFEHTAPVNVEGHMIQACLLTQIFGDAEAAPYREVPTYQCSPSDPVAERKEIKTVDPETDSDEIDHVWTLDLTSFAQQWAEEFSVATNIMLVGAKPEATGSQDSWRVVFAGPKAEKGIETKLVYEPGEITFTPPPPPTGGTGGGFTGGTGTGTTTTDFGSGSTDFGTGTSTGTGTGTDVPAPGTSPSAAPGGLASDTVPTGTQGMPGYVWLALLAGLIGFTLVRQAVIESTTGIRPDGVLAKIHALNADRRGLAAEAASASPGPLAMAGAKISSLVHKLPFRRKV